VDLWQAVGLLSNGCLPVTFCLVPSNGLYWRYGIPAPKFPKGWFKERWKQLDSVRRKRGIGKKLLAEVW
jgi:hypothetical protein